MGGGLEGTWALEGLEVGALEVAGAQGGRDEQTFVCSPVHSLGGTFVRTDGISPAAQKDATDDNDSLHTISVRKSTRQNVYHRSELTASLHEIFSLKAKTVPANSVVKFICANT